MSDFGSESSPIETPVPVDISKDSSISVRLVDATRDIDQACNDLLANLKANSETLNSTLYLSLMSNLNEGRTQQLDIDYKNLRNGQTKTLNIRVQKKNPNTIAQDNVPRAIKDQFILVNDGDWQATQARLPWHEAFDHPVVSNLLQHKVTDNDGRSSFVLPLNGVQN